MATQFFSASEIGELESWPAEVGRDELVQFFQLAVEDVESMLPSEDGDGPALAMNGGGGN
ncbi:MULTISPECIES: hypothetical protein [unclassified Amycolatopsis]|uniref:hypothetical protein n=1 Tax=unclassified Amycolatopsis TaxID=2618356 RepID=UPI001C6A3FA3|nr:hypothetical protein [Amycolatopsis sp. DSM 110486]QYN19030.1 hypothetical protein K1T34_41155 [Amycolatopsis sp. DSM 110486]